MKLTEIAERIRAPHRIAREDLLALSIYARTVLRLARHTDFTFAPEAEAYRLARASFRSELAYHLGGVRS